MIEIEAIIPEGLVTTYNIRNIENYEEFLNKLVIDIENYKKHNKDTIFRISYNGEKITIKRFHRSGSSN